MASPDVQTRPHTSDNSKNEEMNCAAVSSIYRCRTLNERTRRPFPLLGKLIVMRPSVRSN